jgi:hypothetical protein
MSISTYVTPILQKHHAPCIGYVSDMGAGVIRVRCAPDTPPGVSEYPGKFVMSRYASDTPLIRP